MTVEDDELVVVVAAAVSSSRELECLSSLKRSVSPEPNQHFHSYLVELLHFRLRACQK